MEVTMGDENLKVVKITRGSDIKIFLLPAGTTIIQLPMIVNNQSQMLTIPLSSNMEIVIPEEDDVQPKLQQDAEPTSQQTTIREEAADALVEVEEAIMNVLDDPGGQPLESEATKEEGFTQMDENYFVSDDEPEREDTTDLMLDSAEGTFVQMVDAPTDIHTMTVTTEHDNKDEAPNDIHTMTVTTEDEQKDAAPNDIHTMTVVAEHDKNDDASNKPISMTAVAEEDKTLDNETKPEDAEYVTHPKVEFMDCEKTASDVPKKSFLGAFTPLMTRSRIKAQQALEMKQKVMEQKTASRIIKSKTTVKRMQRQVSKKNMQEKETALGKRNGIVAKKNLRCGENKRFKTENSMPDADTMNTEECDIGGEFSSEKAELKKKQGIYMCDKCPRRFKHANGMERHLKTHANKSAVAGGFKCNVCQKSLSTLVGLTFHMRIHKDQKVKTEGSFPCTDCSQTFESRVPLESHSLTHTGLQPFHCDVCQRQFSQKGNRDTHMRIHSGERPFLCSYCGASFRQKAALSYHLSTHQKEHDVETIRKDICRRKDFKCDKCEEVFLNSHAMKIHLRKHMDEKPLGCKYCEKRFFDKPALQSHQWRHEGNYRYSCDKCGKPFIRKQCLKLHQEKHHNEGGKPKQKSHACGQCNKKFVTAALLAEHIRGIHEHDPRYQCKTCGKLFGRLYSVQNHERTHTKEKPFRCELCAQAFSDPSNLLHHMARHGHKPAGVGSRPLVCIPGKSILIHPVDGVNSNWGKILPPANIGRPRKNILDIQTCSGESRNSVLDIKDSPGESRKNVLDNIKISPGESRKNVLDIIQTSPEESRNNVLDIIKTSPGESRKNVLDIESSPEESSSMMQLVG